jgi:hypothetical protein
VRLSNFSDDESRVAGPNVATGDIQSGHVPNPRLSLFMC